MVLWHCMRPHSRLQGPQPGLRRRVSHAEQSGAGDRPAPPTSETQHAQRGDQRIRARIRDAPVREIAGDVHNAPSGVSVAKSRLTCCGQNGIVQLMSIGVRAGV